MPHTYGTFDILQCQKAILRDTVTLNSGIQLAAWFNKSDTVTVKSNHHTLSLYVADGYESYHKTARGWKNGGGPDRFCLMPQECESSWDVRDNLSFVHLYCTDAHLRATGEHIWDRSPASLNVSEKIFATDDKITALYRHCLLDCDWQQPANHLALSTASTLLLTHLIQHYTSAQWQLPRVTGGLSPFVLRNLITFIEENLAKPLTLAELAQQAALSEYHFARMFSQSMKIAPHQYVMLRRIEKARNLIQSTNMALTDIALACGFSSSSHFSHRFKRMAGLTPSQLRAAGR